MMSLTRVIKAFIFSILGAVGALLFAGFVLAGIWLFVYGIGEGNTIAGFVGGIIIVLFVSALSTVMMMPHLDDYLDSRCRQNHQT